jgi:hypothetical protein
MKQSSYCRSLEQIFGGVHDESWPFTMIAAQAVECFSNVLIPHPRCNLQVPTDKKKSARTMSQLPLHATVSFLLHMNFCIYHEQTDAPNPSI